MTETTPNLDADQLLRSRWAARLNRTGTGGFCLPPDFVVEQGRSVHLVDVRRPGEAVGPLGYIPGSSFVHLSDIDKVAAGAPKDLPIVLVSRSGGEASVASARLSKLGMTHVAALEGGVAAWKLMGYATSRDAKPLAAPPRWTQPERELDPPERELPSGKRVLSLRQVREHIGDPHSVRWIRMAALMLHGKTSCVDGRDERGVVGTPGGDAGEFLLAIAAAERLTGKTLDADQIADLLTSYGDTFGRFYMHTDTHALDALRDDLAADARFAEVGEALQTVDGRQQLLLEPPGKLREPLLEHLINPAHVGCGHIRLMLQHSDDYGVRNDLVTSYIRTFYDLWWRGNAELTMTALGGGHSEAAVVNVVLDDDVWPFTQIPLVSPRYGDSQMFVNHPGVAGYMRKQVVRFLIRHPSMRSIGPDNAAALESGLAELAGIQLTHTLGHLAKDLPIYEVAFAADRSFEVRGD